MNEPTFHTPAGTSVSAVTAAEMREIDRIAVEDIGLGLIQMMENAGRNLAEQCRAFYDDDDTQQVVIIAGAGGNGGGGLACARHLLNREVSVSVVLDRDPAELIGAAETQHHILTEMNAPMTTDTDPIDTADLLLDALVGYGLRGAPRGRAPALIEAANRSAAPCLSLDVPSGYDATTGEAPGAVIHPTQTMTLALPKTGLHRIPGDLVLADIAIPAIVYHYLDITYTDPFGDSYRLPIENKPDSNTDD